MQRIDRRIQHLLQLELGGRPAADLIQQRQPHGSLLRLLEQVGAFQSHRSLVGQRRQQHLFGSAKPVLLGRARSQDARSPVCRPSSARATSIRWAPAPAQSAAPGQCLGSPVECRWQRRGLPTPRPEQTAVRAYRPAWLPGWLPHRDCRRTGRPGKPRSAHSAANRSLSCTTVFTTWPGSNARVRALPILLI